MNKKTIVASLNEIANELDSLGSFAEANEVTKIMVKVSQYTNLNPNSAAGRAVMTPPPATGAGSAIATPGYIAVNDSEVYKDFMEIIETHLANGFPDLASEMYLKGLKKLKGDEAKRKFTAQWERALKKNKVGKYAPADPKNPAAPSKPADPSKPKLRSEVGTDTDASLDRWVNKAENIYKAWSVKNPATRNTTDALGLIQDILLYLQEMKFKAAPGSPMEAAVTARYNKVMKMMGDIRAGRNMPTPAVPSPYSGVSGYPAKGPNPFGTGSRLTGTQLTNQADKEVKGI